MKKNIIALALAAVIMFPAASFAATYGYVNTSGMFATVIANNAAEALKLPKDIDAHSGVLLIAPSMMATSTSMTTGIVIVATSSIATSSMMNSTTTATSTMNASSGMMVASSTATTTATTTATSTTK